MFPTQIRSRSTRREGPRVTAPGLLVRAVLGPRRLEIFRVSDGDWQMHAVVDWWVAARSGVATALPAAALMIGSVGISV
jgi:hypothetical protein